LGHQADAWAQFSESGSAVPRPAAQPSMLASGRPPLRLTLRGHSPFSEGPLSSAGAAAHLRDNVDRLTLHWTSPETGANWRSPTA